MLLYHLSGYRTVSAVDVVVFYIFILRNNSPTHKLTQFYPKKIIAATDGQLFKCKMLSVFDFRAYVARGHLCSITLPPARIRLTDRSHVTSSGSRGQCCSTLDLLYL